MATMAKRGTVLVEGNSMAPTYNAGDWLMARWSDYSLTSTLLSKLQHRLHIGNCIAIGDAVVIEREEQPGVYFVKRIADVKVAMGEQTQVYVRSDNSAGTDSRTWGWLPIGEVKARVELRVKGSRQR
jgi:signal peptidase I